MSRKATMRWGLMMVAAIAGIVSQSAAMAADASRPPNFVVVFADDLGYGDLSCYGASGYTTPNLDRLAAEGAKFTDFYVAQGICSASRVALLTGCYPNRVGILEALSPTAKTGINANEWTIAEVLKTKGYATAIYGKWHLGVQPKFLPTRHGFDDYFGLPYSNDMWPKHPTAKFPDLPLIDNETTLEVNPDQTKLTTWYTEHAVSFIEKNRDKPFFLYVPHSMPHVPLFVSEKYAGKTSRGLFGDVIAEVDWSVGQIVAALEKNGLSDNTLVVFTSDNGPWLSYGDHAGSAGPLREGKATAWEGGVREPCVMKWPGKIPAGTVCREPAMTIDLLPTFAKLAGAQLPPNKIDGLDIWPLMVGKDGSGKKGAKSPHDALYFYSGAELHAVRSGKWKLHFPHSYRTLVEAGHGGQPGDYNQAHTDLALYDLEADVGEKNSVATSHPDVLAKLMALAEIARDDLGDKLTKREGKNLRAAGSVE